MLASDVVRLSDPLLLVVRVLGLLGLLMGDALVVAFAWLGFPGVQGRLRVPPTLVLLGGVYLG